MLKRVEEGLGESLSLGVGTGQCHLIHISSFGEHDFSSFLFPRGY